MVEGRAHTTPALQDAPSPNCVALQGRWVNSEGLLKRICRIHPRRTISHYFLGRS
jgi:hypothetical protein